MPGRARLRLREDAKRRLSFVLALIVAVSVLWPTPVVAQTAPDYPHAFPREGVTKRFENERVIIWEVVWPNGVPQPFHRHRVATTTFAYKDVRYWSAGRTHSAVVVNGTPRAILFELQD